MSTDKCSYTMRGCPICGCSNYKRILNLKNTALGDRYVKNQDEALELQQYPLYVVKCQECSHCYIPILTNPDDSYTNYLFQSSQSPGLLKYFEEITETLKCKLQINKDNTIIDIGANDGTWLTFSKIELNI